jgi:AcrR family transcriptional regulator
MPRIAAASIEEHVRIQNERITTAAKRLFSQQGFAATDMGQIATAVGLARNSIYRYYPNKDNILLACIQGDMEPHLQKLEMLAADYPDPQRRILVWIDLQFELATGPAHATMELMGEVRDASVRLGKDVRKLHTAPNAALAAALRELLLDEGDVATLAAMIGGMVLAATAHALLLAEKARPAVNKDLKAAVSKLIGIV